MKQVAIHGNSPYRELYSPYGEPFGGTGTNPTDYSYTGEWQDQNDLVYLRARYYDPATGNFISQDPLETPNRYGYVMGNPIRFIDPTGLNFEDIIPCGLRLPLPYQINQHDIVLCPDSPPPNQAHLTYLAQNEVFLTVNSPECPNDQLAECKPGCWTADGVEYIYKSVQAQNQKINAGSGTFTEYFPKVLVVMSGHDDLYAAYTPPTGTTRTIIWNNGREQWSNGTVIFSPELVTHEFGHVLIQENRGIGIHNQFITAAGGNPAVANISTADGVQTLSIWAPFDSGLPPFDINNPDYNPRTSGRIYGPRGERDFVAISLYAEANGLDYGTAESNWRTFDQQTQKIWIDQATPLMTDERTAEGYAVWVHDVYSTDSRISGQVEAQRVFWNNLFQLATQE